MSIVWSASATSTSEPTGEFAFSVVVPLGMRSVTVLSPLLVILSGTRPRLQSYVMLLYLSLILSIINLRYV